MTRDEKLALLALSDNIKVARLVGKGRVTLHLLPEAALDPFACLTFNSEALDELAPMLFASGTEDVRVTDLDGHSWTRQTARDEARTYTRIFRNGLFEASAA